MALSTGWSAARIAPRTGLPGTPIGSSGAATAQQNPIFAALAKVLGISPQAMPAAFNPTILNGSASTMGPLPATGIDYLARAATAGTPAERVADKIATAAEAAQVPVPLPTPGPIPRSAPGAFSQSGNIVLPNSVYRAAPTPLQSGLARAIGIPSPTIAGTTVSPALSGVPAPVTNAVIPGVTNFNTLANQNQNMPPWLLNAIQNLNNPDNFNPAAPVIPMGGGFDPRIGATMAATEARIAAQQKALDEENKARIARVKADAAASEHAHELNVQRLRGNAVGGYQSGWGTF